MFSYQMIQDIPSCKDAGYIEIIDRGFSHDIKVLVYTKDGAHRLVRIADQAHQAQCEAEFEFLLQCEPLNLPIPKPIEMGFLSNNTYVYRVYTWMNGEDLENVLPKLSKDKQYQLGYESGRILARLHTLKPASDYERWDIRFNAKIDAKIAQYQECSLKYPNDYHLIEEIHALRPLLKDRPSSYQHGDYHIGNMIYGGSLSIIDFNRPDIGDPWEEFNRIIWSVKGSPHFAKGQIQGYFNGEPPELFFKLLKLYLYNNTLASLPWAFSFGEEQIEIMMDNYREVIDWYKDDRFIPSWFFKYLAI